MQGFMLCDYGLEFTNFILISWFVNEVQWDRLLIDLQSPLLNDTRFGEFIKWFSVGGKAPWLY